MTANKILVTGASGFIGSYLVESLVRTGATVRAMLRHTGNLDLIAPEIKHEIEFYTADLRDAAAVSAAMVGIDTVYHLGGIISSPYSIQNPEETVAVNITGTLNILQAMRQHGTARGVIVSTSDVYGTAQYMPVDEKHPLQPQSPYAATKISAEALSISFHRSYQTPVVIVRPFNTYGPRQSTRAVIPTIITQALTQEIVTLGAIHTVRDYTYIADTVHGLLLAAESEAALGQVVNLGTGQSVMIGDVANKIIALIGRPVTIVANDSQRLRPNLSEVLRLESDNRLAKTLLGWQPETDLDTGLQLTIDWIRNHLEQFDTPSP
ncbi:MAG: SDR family NAD(P)-dependent oxidoreductase [Chloroflexota bacterium]